MEIEREERSGPDYYPSQEGLYKWACQEGSIYLGDRKISVRHPRLRGPGGEVALQSYETLKKPGAFSEEILNKVLRGLSARKYRETLMETSHSIRGFARCSVSAYCGEATTQKLQEFKERKLSDLRILCPLYRYDSSGRGGLSGRPGNRYGRA